MTVSKEDNIETFTCGYFSVISCQNENKLCWPYTWRNINTLMWLIAACHVWPPWIPVEEMYLQTGNVSVGTATTEPQALDSTLLWSLRSIQRVHMSSLGIRHWSKECINPWEPSHAWGGWGWEPGFGVILILAVPVYHLHNLPFTPPILKCLIS